MTGASGRVGAHVARELLEHGHRVRVIDRKPVADDLRQSVETIYADIADPLAMLSHVGGCDAIAHIAAYPNPMGVTPAELLRVNVIGTQNILDAAAAHGIPRVVLTSSVGALGFSFPTHPCLPDYLPVDIAHPRRPQDIYGLSKLANEESAAAATRRAGLATIVIRPPIVFDLAHAKAQGWLPRMAERRKEQRDESLWAYIDGHDLAVAYRLALESSLEGHHVFYAMADDVSTDATPRELVERHLPQLLPDVERLTGKGLYDLTPIQEQLGFAATRTWRGVLDEDPS